jgi:DNA-binding PadR family transcriptional regulator
MFRSGSGPGFTAFQGVEAAFEVAGRRAPPLCSTERIGSMASPDASPEGRFMRSIVNCAVLTLVIEKSSYGAEIGHRFQQRYGDYLRSRPNQIYNPLDALVRDGFIEVLPADEARSRGSVRQPRKVYGVTPAGREEHAAWLEAPLTDTASQSEIEVEIAVRLLSISRDDPTEADRVLDLYHDFTVRQAKVIPPEDGTDATLDPWFRERLRLLHEGEKNWIDWVRRDLAGVESDAGSL